MHQLDSEPDGVEDPCLRSAMPIQLSVKAGSPAGAAQLLCLGGGWGWALDWDLWGQWLYLANPCCFTGLATSRWCLENPVAVGHQLDIFLCHDISMLCFLGEIAAFVNEEEKSVDCLYTQQGRPSPARKKGTCLRYLQSNFVVSSAVSCFFLQVSE